MSDKLSESVSLMMNQDSSRDRPIQILKLSESNKKKFELDNEVFKQILMANDVRDCRIAVISIAGAFRQGKSFLLSFFLRYLYAVYDRNDSDWLGDDSSILSGFPWCCGSKRHTTGIWVWSKVFTAIRSNGEKIAVLLMDTQGTWDTQSTMTQNMTIFTLSQMMSSVQIFNLVHNIQEDHLQHLQLFTEYGKVALNNDTDSSPFQRLLFLIRDWQYPHEAQFGFEGGRFILNKSLTIDECEQVEELRSVREHLKLCFDEIDCCLMPYPGEMVSSSPEFNGQLSDIDPKFLDSLKILVPEVLHPDYIVAKKVAGQNIFAKNLNMYLETYWDMFKTGKIPEARTILSATAHANILTTKNDALEFYRKEMYDKTFNQNDILSLAQMMPIHTYALNGSHEIFKSKAIIGDQLMKESALRKLDEEVQHAFYLYLAQIENKKTKSLDETIKSLTSEISQYNSANAIQSKIIDGLKQQLDYYRHSSSEEKSKMLKEIEDLKINLNTEKNMTPFERVRKGQCTIS